MKWPIILLFTILPSFISAQYFEYDPLIRQLKLFSPSDPVPSIHFRNTSTTADWILKHDHTKFHIQDESNEGHEKLTIQSNGNIGIGTTSPEQKLHVVGQAKITVMNTDNTAQNVVVKQSDGTLAVREVSTFSDNTGNYGTVVNPVTGKVWLDRNLGAAQVATSSTDAASYGDLYQWGRGAEGHQVRTSTTTTTKATDWLAGSGSWNSLFITSHSNWLSTEETHMWSGTAAENNTCPSGFRVPTNAEWEQERLTWSSNDAAGAFASPLKLPLAGFRHLSLGEVFHVGSKGYYWSSSNRSGTYSRSLYFDNSNARVEANFIAYGFSVRCIKD